MFLSLNHPNSDHNSAYYTDNISIYKQTYPLAVLNKQVSDWHAPNPKSSKVLVIVLCHALAACRTYSCGVWRPGFPCSESRNLMVAACEWLPPTSLTNKYAMLISRCSTATSGAHLWPVKHGKSTALQRAPKLPHSPIHSVGFHVNSNSSFHIHSIRNLFENFWKNCARNSGNYNRNGSINST